MSLLEKISDRALDAITAYGTSEDCVRKIERFVKAGATYIIIANCGPDHTYTLRAIGKTIIPYFEQSQ